MYPAYRFLRLTLPALILAAAALFGHHGSASAEVFELFNGGRIEGERVGIEEKDGKRFYIIKSTSGAVLTLAAEQVVGEVTKSEAELWYEAWLPKTPDTVEGHLAMARECKVRGLSFQRDHHFLQVIRIDPESEVARRGLGFGRLNGEWIRVDISRRQNGFVRHKGKWWVAQDLAIEREKEQMEEKQNEWNQKIRLLKKIILRKSDKAPAALAELKAIRDPFAVKCLSELAEKGTKDPLRKVYMRVLAEIGTPPAMSTLVKQALVEKKIDVHEYATELIGDSGSMWAARALTAGLKSKSNVIVRRAGKALAPLKDASAVPALIEALNTKHKYVLPSGGNIQAGFSNGGGNGLTSGGGQQVIERTRSNVEVRDALIAVTGMNFGYDETKWWAWYESTHTPQTASLRRSP